MSMRVWGEGPGENERDLTGRHKLADLAARFSGRLTIGVAAVATAILLAILAVAAFTLPAQCNLDPAHPGQCLAPVASGQTATPATADDASGAAKLPVAAAPASAPAAQPAPGSSAKAGSLISATFDQLPAAAVPAANDNAVAAAPQSAAPGAPTTRVVSTTIVHADDAPAAQAAPLSTQGMQIFEQAPEPSPAAAAAPVALADPAPAAAPVANAVPDVAPQTATVDPVLPASPPKRAAAPAATGGGMSVTSGSGVTVRSSPGRGGSQLFALAHGQKVTVTGKQRGWLQIVDAQGRRGWAYSSFFGTR